MAVHPKLQRERTVTTGKSRSVLAVACSTSLSWFGLDSAAPAGSRLHPLAAPLGRRATGPYPPGGAGPLPPRSPPAETDVLGPACWLKILKVKPPNGWGAR